MHIVVISGTIFTRDDFKINLKFYFYKITIIDIPNFYLLLKRNSDYIQINYYVNLTYN